MAQKIVRMCDVCLAEDDAEVDAAPETIGYGGKALGLDLCDAHRASILKPLLDVLSLYGQPVDGSHTPRARKSPQRRTAPQTAASEPKRSGPQVVDGDPMAPGAHPCPVDGCPVVYTSGTGYGSVRKHVERDHGLGTIGGVIGWRCPLCGEQHTKAGPTSLLGHVRDDHDGLTLSQAIVAARAAGDPHQLAERFAVKRGRTT